MQKGFLLSRWWQFFEYDLMFLETLSTRNAPIFSWESLSRSVIIDLGSPWNPGKCVLWLCVQYQVIVARQRRCCGQGLGYTLWVKRSDPCGWLKKIITQRLKEKNTMMSIIEVWNRDVCFSTRFFAPFKMLDIFVELNQKSGCRRKDCGSSLIPRLKVLALSMLQKREFDSVTKWMCVSFQVEDNV